MWRKATLALPGNIPVLNCSVNAAQPWVFGLGQQTENGVYLSPVNAVTWLAEKLAALSEPAEVVIIMAAGQTYEEFMANLDPLADVLPVPAFTQVSRLARSAAELATVKMQKPGGAVNGLAAAAPFSVSTVRSMSSADAAASAAASGSVSMSALKASLEDFSARRDGLLSDLAAAAAELAGKEAAAWVFTHNGDAATLARAVLTDIPAPSSVLSAAVMLVGSDLRAIRGAIHDSHNAGA